MHTLWGETLRCLSCRNGEHVIPRGASCLGKYRCNPPSPDWSELLMKKIILLAALTLIAALTGCADKHDLEDDIAFATAPLGFA